MNTRYNTRREAYEAQDDFSADEQEARRYARQQAQQRLAERQQKQSDVESFLRAAFPGGV